VTSGALSCCPRCCPGGGGDAPLIGCSAALDDRSVCEQLYGRVRGAVDDRIAWLQQFRPGDPARDVTGQIQREDIGLIAVRLRLFAKDDEKDGP